MIISDDENISRVLREHRRIAMVGLSPNEQRPSNSVARYLLAHGYTVIPVNPGQREILGLECHPSLDAIPTPVDMVDVFRSSADVPPIAAAAVRIGARSLWLQIGVINEAAAQQAAAAGLDVIMDRCPKIEHQRLCSDA